MEHIQNMPPGATTDEPAFPSTVSAAGHSGPRLSTELTEALIETALASGRDVRPGRAWRADGWTPDRIRTFLESLAASGVASEAARAAGMTKQSAYALRNSTKGRAFALAWRAALLLARRRVADELLARALKGTVEITWRDGRVWEERHRFDNRLGLALLDRLDRLAADNDGGNAAARFVAEEFTQFVDIVAAGGEGAAAFVAARCGLGYRGHDEMQVLERAENFAAAGDGLPEGYEALESGAAGMVRALAELLGEDEEEEAGETGGGEEAEASDDAGESCDWDGAGEAVGQESGNGEGQRCDAAAGVGP